jgi:nuclear pore complex protein Nup160
MTGEYLPLELVHAHLPAAPAPPNSIRLIPISDIPKPPSKDTPLHREHASSAAFDPVHNVQARIIHNGYILELRQIDLHRSQSDEPLRIAFHRPLLDLPANCFASTSTHLCLYVATERSLHRLRFPARPHVKFVTEQAWVESYESSEDAITPWLAVDEDLVVMTGADGSLVTIAYQEEGTLWHCHD